VFLIRPAETNHIPSHSLVRASIDDEELCDISDFSCCHDGNGLDAYMLGVFSCEACRKNNNNNNNTPNTICCSEDEEDYDDCCESWWI